MSVWCYPPQALAVPRRKEGGHGGLEGHGCPAEVRTGAHKPRPDVPQAPRPSRLTPASWWPGVSGVVGFPGNDPLSPTQTTKQAGNAHVSRRKVASPSGPLAALDEGASGNGRRPRGTQTGRRGQGGTVTSQTPVATPAGSKAKGAPRGLDLPTASSGAAGPPSGRGVSGSRLQPCLLSPGLHRPVILTGQGAPGAHWQPPASGPHTDGVPWQLARREGLGPHRPRWEATAGAGGHVARVPVSAVPRPRILLWEPIGDGNRRMQRLALSPGTGTER